MDDAAAFSRYQVHHYQAYGHIARVTFEPVMDMDAMFAPMLAEIRAKAK